MVNDKPYLGMATVLAIEPVMPSVFRLRLQCPEIASIAKPGQFVMVKCGDQTLLRRPISISDASAPSEQISLLIAKIGSGTEWLSHRVPGEELDILGPLGNGFTIDDNAQHLLLIGGGMGIAPLNFLAGKAAAMGKNVTLVLGARSGDLICPSEFLTPVNKCISCTEDGTLGIKGRITECPDNFMANAEQIFACGPLPMYRALAKDRRFRGKPMQVSLEVRMACGIGLCYGCTVKTRQGLRQVCEDGPVFEMSDVLWEELADL